MFLVGTGWIWRGVFVSDVQVEQLEQAQRYNNLNTTTVKQVSDEKDSSPDLSRARNDTVNLVVPFTSQAPEKNWDEPWQDACEEAALLMLDAYYKNYNLSPLFAKDEILKITRWEEEQGWGNSIPIEKVLSIAKDYFKLDVVNIKEKEIKKLRNLEILENPTVDDIKRSIANGNPVLATADGKVLPNPHFRNGGPVYHALIIKGYTDTDFITNDPGTQFGADFKYKYNDLLDAIHDWNNGDVRNGKKVMLVIGGKEF